MLSHGDEVQITIPAVIVGVVKQPDPYGQAPRVMVRLDAGVDVMVFRSQISEMPDAWGD